MNAQSMANSFIFHNFCLKLKYYVGLTFFQPTDGLNVINKFSVNQNEGVYNQLLFGIRYLDIRVSYYENTPEKFWVVHDFIKRNPLFEVINDVQKFLKASNDIVIMDFHR